MLAVGIGMWPRRAAAGAIEFAPPALPSGVTLTRVTPGTRTNAAGASTSEAADVARFDHHPVTLAYQGLLIEEARTNQIPASQDLSQAVWSRTGAASGTVSAIVETTANSSHHVRTAAGVTLSTGQTITASLIAGERAGSQKRYLSFSFAQSNAGFGGVAVGATFDLAAGTVTGVGPVVAGMSARGGGRWLCWWRATPTANATGDFLFLRLLDPPNAGSPSASYTGDGASGIDVNQVQVEVGATPSSRIATTTAAATRAADVVRIDGARLGVGDGPVPVRVGFDDGSEQRLTLSVAGGVATLSTALARSIVRRIERG